jgi:endonuclease YncB( thermonuclease family)
MIVKTAASTILTFLILAVPAYATEFTGRAERIVDGDTFWLCNQTTCNKIRLCGVDAPERGDRGYGESTSALEALVRSEEVSCIQVGGGTPCDGRSRSTNRDRIVAQCFVNGKDIAAYLVETNFACDWVKFSGGHYGKANGRTCAK